MIKGIPVGQLLRVRRICNDYLQFEQGAKSLYGRFLQCGYPRWMLNRALNIARQKSRTELLQKVNQKRNERANLLTLSTAFSSEFSQIKGIFNRHLNSLYSDEV